MLIAILRIVIPLLIILIVARLVWPRYRSFKKQKTDRIEVEATVVKSEQHKVSDEEER